MNEPVYLDGFSTTPLAPEAREAMLAAFDEPGNASSQHAAGQRAAGTVESARALVASLINAAPTEIVFTSGATEADNLALIGVARALRKSGSDRNKIIVSTIEHKAVLEAAAALRWEAYEVNLAPVDRFGRLDLTAFQALVDEQTALVSIMAANNETGVIQPIEEAAAAAHRVGALFHSDAAQAVGKIPTDVVELGVDYLSISSHKMYGPMGIGALFVSAAATKPLPITYGGGQENGLRPGTEPVALIAGFGAAARASAERLTDANKNVARVNDLLVGLAERQIRYRRISGPHPVVPGSAAIAIDGIDAEDLCLKLAREVQISTGSACTSGQLRRSHVLEAMGFSELEASEVVRLFCGRFVTDEDVARAAEKIASASH
ncbi:cysteine desulfurase family protein [Sphingomonas agri]|uniref:cysteine desulfurase family protein n=1 Tax=Sphingomonas agri TaxID=1813878 RepID=UPI00311D623F